MNPFLDDEFMNKRLFSKMIREVKEESLNKTINEIDYLNEIQECVLQRQGFKTKENEQLDFIKKLRIARRNDAIRKCFKS